MSIETLKLIPAKIAGNIDVPPHLKTRHPPFRHVVLETVGMSIVSPDIEIESSTGAWFVMSTVSCREILYREHQRRVHDLINVLGCKSIRIAFLFRGNPRVGIEETGKPKRQIRLEIKQKLSLYAERICQFINHLENAYRIGDRTKVYVGKFYYAPQSSYCFVFEFPLFWMLNRFAFYFITLIGRLMYNRIFAEKIHNINSLQKLYEFVSDVHGSFSESYLNISAKYGITEGEYPFNMRYAMRNDYMFLLESLLLVNGLLSFYRSYRRKHRDYTPLVRGSDPFEFYNNASCGFHTLSQEPKPKYRDADAERYSVADRAARHFVCKEIKKRLPKWTQGVKQDWAAKLKKDRINFWV